MARNPVLLIMSLLAGVSAILGLGVLQDLISDQTIGWVLVGYAGLQAAVQFWVKGEVTPMIDPRDYDGARLVPAKHVRETE